jgi:hypothetical protein
MVASPNLTYWFRRDFVGDPLNKEFAIHYGTRCPYTYKDPNDWIQKRRI